MRVGEGLLMSSPPPSEPLGAGVRAAQAAPARPDCRARAALARVGLSLAMKQPPCSGPFSLRPGPALAHARLHLEIASWPELTRSTRNPADSRVVPSAPTARVGTNTQFSRIEYLISVGRRREPTGARVRCAGAARLPRSAPIDGNR